jgi:hypothetical protein
MSYDLNLFTAKSAIGLPPTLSAAAQVAVEGPLVIDEDDLGQAELAAIGKRRILFQIHIEGRLSESDWQTVEAWLASNLTTTKGVLVDPQSGTFETPTRSGTLTQDKKKQRDPFWLCFWFKDGEGFHAHGFAEMLDTLSKIMPAALPIRYGRFEPLQGKVEGGDLAPVMAAFAEDADLLLKASSPFAGIHMSIPCSNRFSQFHPQHWIRRHFLLASVKFEVKPSLLNDTQGYLALLALFERLSVQFDVVYSEISSPQEYAPGSWFWEGLPDSAPRAFCIGHEYRAVWHEADAYGREIGASHRLFSSARDGGGMPKVPSRLLAPEKRSLSRDRTGPPNLADVFPFAYQYSSDNYIW